MRGLAPIAVAAWLATAAGCSSSPATRFYTLTAMVATDRDTARKPDSPGIAVGLRRVTLPEYLDRPQIVTRLSPTKIDLAEFDRWAEPLAEGFAAALAENLSVMIPADQVSVFPWARTARIDYEITVDVMRFEGRLGGTCDLDARWRLSDRRGKEPPIMGRSSVSEPAGDTYEAMVAAHSRLVTALGRDIAAALDKVASAGARARGK